MRPPLTPSQLLALPEGAPQDANTSPTPEDGTAEGYHLLNGTLWLSTRALARELGVRPTAIRRLAKRHHWTHQGHRFAPLWHNGLLDDYWLSTPNPRNRRGARCVRSLPYPLHMLPSLRGLEHHRLIRCRHLPLLPLFMAIRPGHLPHLRFSLEDIDQWLVSLTPSQHSRAMSFTTPPLGEPTSP